MGSSSVCTSRKCRIGETRRLWRAGSLAGAILLTLSGGLLLTSAPASANSGTITANGAPVTATVSTPGVPATFTFAGTSGEVVTASTSGGTFASPCDVNLVLLDPSGGTVASTSCAGTVGGFLGETTLPGAGTYTLELSPTNSDTGSVSLSLTQNASSASIVANGAPVTFTSATRTSPGTGPVTGQGQNLTFNGKSGESVTVSAYGGTFPGSCDMNMYLVDASGNLLANAGCSGSQAFIAATPLEGKGTYTIKLVPESADAGSNSGSVTVSLTAEQTPVAIVANGAPLTFTSATRLSPGTGKVTGQGGSYTFSGTAGEVVTVSTFGGTFPSGCDLSLTLVTAAGNTLGSGGCSAQQGFIGETTLPGTGTYAIQLIPQGASIGTNSGSVTVALTKNPSNGAITPNGATVTFTSTHTGEGRTFAFTGKAHQVVTLSAFGGTFPSSCDLSMTLVSASGTSLGNAGCSAQQGFIGEVVLPAKGTYLVELTPQGSSVGSNTGSVTLALTANASPLAITANGASQTFTSTHTGQGQNYTFSGTTGQIVSLTTSAGTFPTNCDLTLALVSPSGSQVASSSCAAVSGSIAGATLPGTGNYTVELIPQGSNVGSNTGSVTVKLTSP